MKANHLRFLKTCRTSKPSAAARSLIEAAKTLLESHPPGEITTTMVLDEAGVARGTLYLHFQNHTALLEVALLELFVGGVRSHLELLKESLENSQSKNDFIKRVTDVIELSQSPQRRTFRIDRCRLIAHCDRNPRFSSLLGDEQARINEGFTSFFIALRKKGWMGKKLAPETASVLIQALTLGRAVDDVSSVRLSEKAWNDAFMMIVKDVILGGSSIRLVK
jgi:AcrR family transcriptional regulator